MDHRSFVEVTGTTAASNAAHMPLAARPNFQAQTPINPANSPPADRNALAPQHDHQATIPETRRALRAARAAAHLLAVYANGFAQFYTDTSPANRLRVAKGPRLARPSPLLAVRYRIHRVDRALWDDGKCA